MEYCFIKEHTNDWGANSQQIFFLSKQQNNNIFGKDAYKDESLEYNQDNYNTLVKVSNKTALERGAEFIIIDASKITLENTNVTNKT